MKQMMVMKGFIVAAVSLMAFAADLAILVSRVATEVRVYDGRTLELLRSFHLERHGTAVVPTGIGVGNMTGDIAFWAAVPLMRWFHDRGAARDVAADAALAIAREIPH
jgi:hypothetical protein